MLPITAGVFQSCPPRKSFRPRSKAVQTWNCETVTTRQCCAADTQGRARRMLRKRDVRIKQASRTPSTALLPRFSDPGKRDEGVTDRRGAETQRLRAVYNLPQRCFEGCVQRKIGPRSEVKRQQHRSQQQRRQQRWRFAAPMHKVAVMVW